MFPRSPRKLINHVSVTCTAATAKLGTQTLNDNDHGGHECWNSRLDWTEGQFQPLMSCTSLWICSFTLVDLWTLLGSTKQQGPSEKNYAKQAGQHAVFPLPLFRLRMNPKNYNKFLLWFHTLGLPNVHNFLSFVVFHHSWKIRDS